MLTLDWTSLSVQCPTAFYLWQMLFFSSTEKVSHGSTGIASESNSFEYSGFLYILTTIHDGKLQAEKSNFWCLSHISAAAPWSACTVHSSFTWTVSLTPWVYSQVHHFHTPLSSPHPSTHQLICRLVLLPVYLYFLSGRRPICLMLCLFSVQQFHWPANPLASVLSTLVSS